MMNVSVKCGLKYYNFWNRVKNSTIVNGDTTLRVQVFDKRLDYFYVTGKYDGPQAVRWLFINICYGMENKTTRTHFLF
jgi:hypothetical protein